MSRSAPARSRRGPAAAVTGALSLVMLVVAACVAPQPPSSKPPFTTTTAPKLASSTTTATTIGTTPTSSSTTTSSSSSVPSPGGTVTVLPFAETVDYQPMGVNDADSPAIWVHRSQPAKSLVLGTLKEAGLDVYSPAGAIVQSIRPGAGHRF